ncbi:MAG: 16S rRNA processing protein RimM [Chitinophagaceae bacterium]|nr:16S rRNA processing protein RimM [Chitinophagaceae bacterium]
MPEYFKIGKIVSAFGLNGEVIVVHSLGKKTSLKGVEAIFIENRKESFLPYFISTCRVKSDNELYLQLEDVTTREMAARLLQKEVWVTGEHFNKLASKSAPIALLGYRLINDSEDIGEIVEVIEQPFQVLCKVIIEGKEALIPLNQETLKEVDNKNRQVFVFLPEGLLDIYKGN